MTQKSVSDLIIDKFAEDIKKDDLFSQISTDLINLVNQRKISKNDLGRLLRQKQNEDSKSGS